MRYAIELARATSAPLLGALIGLHSIGPGQGSTAALALRSVPDVSAGPTELGVLADLTLGAAIRARCGADRRLATISLAMELAGPLPRMSQLSADAVQIAGGRMTGETAVVAGTVRCDRTPIGSMSAAFSLRDSGMPLIPWECDPVPEVLVRPQSELTAEEIDVLRTVTGSAQAPGTALLLAAIDVERSALHAGPVLANRAGAVQGGVVFGFAAHAAQPCSGGALLSARVDFLAPALITDEVVAVATVLRDGRRQRTTRVDVRQREQVVATATFRHERWVDGQR